MKIRTSLRPARPRAVLGVVLAASAALALTACSSGASASSDTVPSASLQLNYLENVQFAGSLVAEDKGYYSKNGVKVSLIAGGPNLSVEPVVAGGKALVGITHTATAVNAINNGAGLTIIGAGYQKNPFCIVSLAGKPITKPSDLIGKKIGVSATNLPVWNAFLKANGIAPSKVTVVTIDFDPTPLATGEVDGFVAFYTNEPTILEEKGIKVSTMLLNDFGYPLLEDVYVARTADLKNPTKRAQIVDLMKGEAQGWKEAVSDPNLSADLAVNKYGKDLKLSMTQQVSQATKQNDLVVSPTTQQHGLFWMSDADIQKTIGSLKLGGSDAKASMFSDEILKDVYSGTSSK
jgi:ABC-type nitrate/sulfonate/bicarbonate transport system substrate-binding protein